MPAAIDGQPVALLIDTGADTALVTPEAVVALRLRRDPLRRSRLSGTGGDPQDSDTGTPNAILSDLALGGLHLLRRSVPVAALPAAPLLTPRVAGLLGADLLGSFDVLIDVPARHLALLPPGCGTPWPGADRVVLDRAGDRLLAPVALDGTPLFALVDTGARALVLDRAAAGRLGVTDAALDADPGGITQGIDLHDVTFHWHRFARLQVGATVLRDPVLTVFPLAEEAPMLLGAAWFQPRRVLLSYAGQMMVFDPDPAR